MTPVSTSSVIIWHEQFPDYSERLAVMAMSASAWMAGDIGLEFAPMY